MSFKRFFLDSRNPQDRQMVESPNGAFMYVEDHERLMAEALHDIEAYRGALGYPVTADHNGRLSDGTTPICGLCDARYRAADSADAGRLPSPVECYSNPYLLDTQEKVDWANRHVVYGHRWKLGDSCHHRPAVTVSAAPVKHAFHCMLNHGDFYCSCGAADPTTEAPE